VAVATACLSLKNSKLSHSCSNSAQVNTLQPQITQELLCMGRGIYKGKEKAIDLQSEVSSLIGSN